MTLDKLTDEEMEEGAETRFGQALLRELRSRRKEYMTYVTRVASGGGSASSDSGIGLMCSLGGKAMLCDELITLIDRNNKDARQL